MLEKARNRFADDPHFTIIAHDMVHPLPDLGTFDAIVSSFAIHHLEDVRKRTLYAELYALLNPGGIFCNLEHVASVSAERHDRFLKAINYTRATEDTENKLASIESQLVWLREAGFMEVDCHWKWLELALIAGVKPKQVRSIRSRSTKGEKSKYNVESLPFTKSRLGRLEACTTRGAPALGYPKTAVTLACGMAVNGQPFTGHHDEKI